MTGVGATQPTSQALLPVESLQLIEKTLTFCNSITEIKIGTSEEYKNACELTGEVQIYVKKLDSDRKSIVKPFNEKVIEINKMYKHPKKALDNLRSRLRQSITGYQQELARIQEEKQRLVDKEAEKERERLRKESKKTGQEDLKQVAETIKTPVIPKEEPPPVDKMHFREQWSAEVVDKKTFIEYCLNSGELHFLEINTATLDKLAQTSKGKMQLPGITFNCEKVPVFRK